MKRTPLDEARKALANADAAPCRAQYNDPDHPGESEACTKPLGHKGKHGACAHWAREPERAWLRAALEAVDHEQARVNTTRSELLNDYLFLSGLSGIVSGQTLLNVRERLTAIKKTLDATREAD